MSFTHSLFNPTPFSVAIDWDKGVKIRIPADGSVDLTTRQMEQFMPGEPGAEEIRKLLDTYGVFLKDSSRDFDAQALETLKKCIKTKRDRYTEALTRMQDAHASAGMAVEEESKPVQAKLKSMGLLRLQEECDILQKRIDLYSQVVEEEDNLVTRAPKFDPKRTIFILDPPQEFSSVTAMNVFLAENPEVSEVHNQDVERRAAMEEYGESTDAL